MQEGVLQLKFEAVDWLECGGRSGWSRASSSGAGWYSVCVVCRRSVMSLVFQSIPFDRPPIGHRCVSSVAVQARWR